MVSGLDYDFFMAAGVADGTDTQRSVPTAASSCPSENHKYFTSVLDLL